MYQNFGYLKRQIEMKLSEVNRKPVKLNLAKNYILLSCLLLKSVIQYLAEYCLQVCLFQYSFQ